MINFEHRKEQTSKKSIQCVTFVRTKIHFITTDQPRNHKDNEHRMKNKEINPTNELKYIKCRVGAKLFTSLNEQTSDHREVD